MNVRVMPEDSEVKRHLRYTEQKDFDLATVSISDASYALQGEGGYAGVRAYPVRAVWHLSDTFWGWVVRGDSRFKTIYDLKQKGVKVAVASQSPPMIVAAKEALPAFLGWTKEEAEKNWTFIPVGSYAENCRSVTDGKADVAWMSPGSSIVFELEAHPKKIRWLDQPKSDKKGWEGYTRVRPQHAPATIDFGVPSAKGSQGSTANFLYWGRADMDQELVYQLAKWFDQAHSTYKDVHPLCERMSLKYFRNYLNFSAWPVAEGTIRYLREVGQWTKKDDQWNAEAIKHVDRWVKARNAAIDEANAKGVKIHWESKEYLEILKKHTEGIPPFKVRI
jgi:TRAP transporter TAXI family solute receptor